MNDSKKKKKSVRHVIHFSEQVLHNPRYLLDLEINSQHDHDIKAMADCPDQCG